MRLPSMPASVGPWGRGLAAWLPRVCAAPVPRAVERLVPTASTRGADCTAGGVELRVAVPAATAGCRAFGHGQCEGLVVVVVREVVLTGSLCSQALVRGCRVVQRRRGQDPRYPARHPLGGPEVIRCR